MTRLEFLMHSQSARLAVLRIENALETAELIQSGEQDAMVSTEVAEFATTMGTAGDAIEARVARIKAKGQTLSADDKAALTTVGERFVALGNVVDDPATPPADGGLA